MNHERRSRSRRFGLRSLSLALILVPTLTCIAGCGGDEASAVADQDELQQFLNANPDLQEPGSEEPNTAREEAPRSVPDAV